MNPSTFIEPRAPLNNSSSSKNSDKLDISIEVQSAPIESKRKSSILNSFFGNLLPTSNPIALENSQKDPYISINQKIARTAKGIKSQIFSGFLKEEKQKLNNFIELRIERMIINQVKIFPKEIKKRIKKPEMPGPVHSIIDHSIDEIWPDIEQEILFQLRIYSGQVYLPEPEAKNFSGLFCLFYYFRAWFRYNFDPVDISFWKKLKRFSFYFLHGIEYFPFLGVQSAFRALWWILMDKSDQFQVTKFIIDYKIVQFLTSGCLTSILGYIQFFYCSFFSKGDFYSGKTDCQIFTKFDTVFVVTEFFAFVLQILLIWTCYFYLPWTLQKGMPKFKREELFKKKLETGEKSNVQKGILQKRLESIGNSLKSFDNLEKINIFKRKSKKEEIALLENKLEIENDNSHLEEQKEPTILDLNNKNDKNLAPVENLEKYNLKPSKNPKITFLDCSRSSRVHYFMLWELLSTIFFLTIFIKLGEAQRFKKVSIRSTLFFCKSIYGLLGFPFIIFVFRPLIQFLTEAKATKYDM